MTLQQSDITVNYANQVMVAVQQIASLRSIVSALLAFNNVNPLATLWNELNTTALNADGSLGTADGTPTSGHYIDSRVYPAVSRVIKNTDLSNALQVLTEFNTFCS